MLDRVDRRTPLHATASGEVLLAFGPERVRRQVLAGPLEAYTPVTDPAALEAELAAVRDRGWATTEGSSSPG